METNNKFFVYDSYVFAFKNALANVRIFTIACLSFIAVLIPVALVAFFITKTTLAGITLRALPTWLLSNMATSLGFALILLSVVLLFFTWVIMTIIQISLAIHDTGTAEFQAIIPEPLVLIKGCIATLMYFFVMILGLICFIIPGLYWILRSWFYLYAIIEGQSIMQAFSTSFKLTKGKEWYIFTLLLAASVLGSALQIFAVPVITLSNVYLYRYLAKGNK